MINFSVNQPEQGKKYYERIGVYVIIIRDNLLAIVKTKGGYFLPGGGLEKNESMEECLKRECREELGVNVEIISRIGQINYFFYSTTKNTDIENIGHFYKGIIVNEVNAKTEKDHELIWLDQNEAIKLLFLKNQKEAVRLFVKNA